MSEPVRVGVATSLSGRYAPFGRQVVEGLRCYLRDANRDGGIRVAPARLRPVELRVEDDRSDPRVLRERVRKLVREDQVGLLFGPYGSGLTLAAAEVASELGVVLWNHSGASDEIHGRYPRWTVGVLSPASTYLTAVLDMVEAVAPPVRRIGLLQGDTGFGAELCRGVLEWSTRRECSVWRRVYRPGNVERIDAMTRDLVSEPVDVLLGAGRFEDDVTLAESLWRVRPSVRSVALVAAGIDRFQEMLGDRAEGVLAPSQWDRRARIAADFGPGPDAFVASYGSGTSLPLDYPAAQAYAAALVAQWCVEQSGSLDPGILRSTAERARLTTFYGRFRIDPSTGGQTGHEILVTRWRGGRREVLWPRHAANATGPPLATPWEG